MSDDIKARLDAARRLYEDAGVSGKNGVTLMVDAKDRIEALEDALDKIRADEREKTFLEAANIAKEIADQFVGYMSRIERALRNRAAAIREDKT